MAPKTRSGKVLGTVVTKKVVEETVQIVVSPDEEGKGEDEDERMEVVSETVKENEKVEVIYSSGKRSPVKVVVVGDKAEEEDQRPPQPEEDLEQPQQEQGNQEVEQLKQQQEEEEQRRHQKQEEEQAEALLQPEEGKEQEEEEEEERSEAEDEETQPASQPEVAPASTPPKFEQPPRKEEEEGGKKRKTKEGKAVVKDHQKKKTTQKGRGVKEGGKRRKKRAKVGGGDGAEYKRYVFRVMKQVHPDMGISSKAMTIINNLMSDMFERIADEASKLSRYIGRATLSSMEIRDAVKLVLPGDLGQHAIAEGSKAVTNYVANVTGDPKFKTKTKP